MLSHGFFWKYGPLKGYLSLVLNQNKNPQTTCFCIKFEKSAKSTHPNACIHTVEHTYSYIHVVESICVNFTSGASQSQRYCMVLDGWTVWVIGTVLFICEVPKRGRYESLTKHDFFFEFHEILVKFDLFWQKYCKKHFKWNFHRTVIMTTKNLILLFVNMWDEGWMGRKEGQRMEGWGWGVRGKE